MTAWGVKQRLFYLGIVVAVLAVIGGVVFWRTRPAPSCFDNKQNQAELGVDCGSPCAKVCPFEVKALKEVWSRIFPLGTGRYDGATLVKNLNPHHAARQLTYRLRFFDHDGILVTTREGEAFVNPGESLFLFQTRLDVGQRVPERAVFSIVDGPIWQRLDKAMPKLKISYESFTNEPTPLLTATIGNESLADLSDIQVVALLADEDENALAISSTLVDRLDHGTEKEIVFTWPTPFPIEPTFFDFYPHLDLARIP